MNRNHSRRPRQARQSRVIRKWMTVFIALMLVGMAVQITMIARVTRQNKQVRRVEREIVELQANVDNLNLTLNQYGSLERVELLARRLGMKEPDEGQIRVMRLPETQEDTAAQNAANTGAEEKKE